MMRILIFILLAYLAYRVVKLLFKPKKEIRRGPNGGVIDEMVQDPVCKTYIPRRDAVKKKIGGRDYFFCSEACASKFEPEKGDT
jgi:YHS domain-containing protein